MKSKKFVALICGYGVPKDIFQDKSYHAYLTICVNWLFDRYADQGGIITVNGGPTDCYKPFQRTEAGEMIKWLRVKKKEIESRTERKLAWQLVAKPKSLSTVENLLNVKPLVKPGRDLIIFCEKTRASRIRKLSRALFPKQKLTIVPIDFDGSSRRYTPVRTARSEKEFLAMEIKAAFDPKALQILRRFMKKKLAIMREHTPSVAHQKLPSILEELHAEYRKTKKRA